MNPIPALEAHCLDFDLSSLNRARPALIYFLISDDEIVYIGQTTFLQTRIALHITGGQTFNRVMWLPVQADDADAFEGALIRALDPRCCLAAPADRGRDTEVLARIGLAPDPEARRRFEARRRERWPRTIQTVRSVRRRRGDAA